MEPACVSGPVCADDSILLLHVHDRLKSQVRSDDSFFYQENTISLQQLLVLYFGSPEKRI